MTCIIVKEFEEGGQICVEVHGIGERDGAQLRIKSGESGGILVAMVICWHRAKIEIFLETLEKLPSTSLVLVEYLTIFDQYAFYTRLTSFGL